MLSFQILAEKRISHVKKN